MQNIKTGEREPVKVQKRRYSHFPWMSVTDFAKDVNNIIGATRLA